MPSIQQHIIRRQVFQVEVSGTESDGFAVQRRLPELCHALLTPALEPVLVRSVPAGEHLTIDRLEIDAGTFTLENLERGLVEAVTQALAKLLRERAPPAGSASFSSSIQRRTEAQSVEEAFLHFLRTGSLPWWFHLPLGKTLEEVVQASWQTERQTGGLPGYSGRSMIDAIGSVSVRKRLVQQFSADFLETLLGSLSQEAAVAKDEVLTKLGTRDFAAGALRGFSEQLWQTVFAVVAAGRRPTARALVAEYFNSLPDAERQEPAQLEWIARLLTEAPSRDSEPEGEASPDRESEPDREALPSSDGEPDEETLLGGNGDPAKNALLRSDRDTGEGGLLRTDSATEEKTSLHSNSVSDRETLRSSDSEPDKEALLSSDRDTGERRLLWTDSQIGEKIPLHSNSKPDRETLLGGESEPDEKALPDRDPDNKTRHFTDRAVVKAKNAAREEAIVPIDLEEGLYIRCAGLALLHPFLPQLFEALGIALEDRLVQPGRALCLLHFLATGRRVAPEYELLLPKLLCNVPFEEAVESRIDLTTAEEEEAVALLEAVIRHWSALGDTSVDGLRGTYLARPGKLSQRDDGDHLLQVEARSFDILLDRLPWGIGTIRLPWMKRILWVEWRS